MAKRGTTKGKAPAQDICGLVMPISGSDTYPVGHWVQVRQILDEALRSAGLSVTMVSDADESSVIHRRIVENLYTVPLVVCDVSSRNPNVMFELGMRLAFDRATIVVKDSVTPYSFDTSPIEHLQYPRDLNYSQIVEFKARLKAKAKATLAKAKEPEYSTFLKHFGTFKSVSIETEAASRDDLVLRAIEDLAESVRRNSTPSRPPGTGYVGEFGAVDITIHREAESMDAVGKKLEPFSEFAVVDRTGPQTFRCHFGELITPVKFDQILKSLHSRIRGIIHVRLRKPNSTRPK